MTTDQEGSEAGQVIGVETPTAIEASVVLDAARLSDGARAIRLIAELRDKDKRACDLLLICVTHSSASWIEIAQRLGVSTQTCWLTRHRLRREYPELLCLVS